MNVCLHAFGTEEAEFLGRDGREESVAHKIHASNSHVLKSRLCERDKTKSKVAPFRTGGVTRQCAADQTADGFTPPVAIGKRWSPAGSAQGKLVSFNPPNATL